MPGLCLCLAVGAGYPRGGPEERQVGEKVTCASHLLSKSQLGGDRGLPLPSFLFL